jgi:hypothetical protein
MEEQGGGGGMKDLGRDRAVIFTTAIVVRGVIGWIFFGSVDVTNALLNSYRLFLGMALPEIPVPYLPGVHQLLLAISGILAFHTPLPVTFCYKLFPLLFDGVLAVLVYDFLLPDRRRAFRSGLLYALCPVSIIITAIHTQWDAMAFAFFVLSFALVAKRSVPAWWLAGAAFVLSVLVKPVVIPFLPLLFPAPWRIFRRGEERKQTSALIGGMAACTGLYFSVLYAIGDPLTPEVLSGILSYAERNVRLLGLPVLLGSDSNRLLTLLPLVLLIPLHWKGLVTRSEAVAMTLAIIVAVGGIAPQYLIWIVPFLLISGKERYAALYNLFGGLFLVIYYHHPGLQGFNMENLGAYAPLQALSFLAPAATNMDIKTFLFAALGSFAIPISALVFFIVEMRRIGRRAPAGEPIPPLSLAQLLTPAAIATGAIVVAGFIALGLHAPPSGEFANMVYARAGEYTMHLYSGPGLVNPHEPSWVIPAYAGFEVKPRVIDAVSIGYVWVLLWSVIAWASAPRTETRVEGLRIEPVVAASTIAMAVVLVCHAAGVMAQLIRSPHVDEAEYLHAGYLMSEGLRIYRDFFEHHAPFLFQLLAAVVPSSSSEFFPVMDLFAYIERARVVAALMGTTAVIAAAWLAYSISRWVGAPVVVAAALFAARATWYRGVVDVRNDAPGLMLFWVGAALLLHRWRTPARGALASGVGIGLAFASALWNPKWPFACLVLGLVYLVRLWWSWKAGVRVLLAAIGPAVALVAATLATITSAASLSDYIHFTFDYTMRLGEWWKVNEHQRRTFFPTPLTFCPAIFKGWLPLVAAASAIAILALRRGREQLALAQRWQLGTIGALVLIAILELRFVAPYPNLWAQYFMMYCFAMAVLYAVVAGMALQLLPAPRRGGAGIAAVTALTVLFVMAFWTRMRPISVEENIYYATASHMQKTLAPDDTVWVGSPVHPVAARDAHYYWFGFNEHLAFVLEAEKRGDLPAFLPRVDLRDLPSCRAALGRDPHVRFVMVGDDVQQVPIVARCVQALIRSGRGLTAEPPFHRFVKIER